MNVVIFGKGLGKPRQLNLSGPLAAAAVLLVAGVVAAASFAGGHWYAAATGSGVSSNELDPSDTGGPSMSPPSCWRRFARKTKTHSTRWHSASHR